MPTQTPASAPRGTQKVSRSAVAAPARKPTTKQKNPLPHRADAPKSQISSFAFCMVWSADYTLAANVVQVCPVHSHSGFHGLVQLYGRPQWLFQGELAPRRIVDLMLQGYDVSNFEQMNEIEREVVQLFAQDVPDTPEVIGIGSSRVLQFTRELVGTDSFFNMGVTGADVRDNMTSYYKMVCYGKAPKVLIWSVDPWVLYGDEAAFDKRADVELYNEFLTKVLGVETDYEEEDRVALWKALVEPAYFQGNVDYYLKNRGQSVVTDDDGNPIDFNPVDGDPYEQPTTIKRSDGSVLYDPAFRDANPDQVRALAAEACPTFNSVHMEGLRLAFPQAGKKRLTSLSSMRKTRAPR
mgnify:CR=1 FL=1